MEITWLGHSCFRLKGSEATVITDPYAPDLGYTLGKPKADIVTVSHQHSDHNYVQGIPDARVISGPGEYEISNVLVLGITTYHDDVQGAQRGKNTVYLVEMDEVTVCHLGDLGHVLTSEQTEELDNVDVLLIPVGGVFTIDARLAAEVVRQLSPKVVIPMHYKTPVVTLELEPVDRFLRELGVSNLEPSPKLSVTKSNLPEHLQVHLLSY
jgi:L-ascorbate metabolism protein UlaG (beta-lactamase superfamily)